MSQMTGADVVALRQLAQQMKTSGQRLEQIASETGGQVNSSSWRGPDFDHFNSSWNNQLRVQLINVGERLGESSSTLLAQAAEQERASESDGGLSSTPGTPTGPGTPPRLPGNGDDTCLGTCKFTGLPGAINEFFEQSVVAWTNSALLTVGLTSDIVGTKLGEAAEVINAFNRAFGEGGDLLDIASPLKTLKGLSTAGQVLGGIGIATDLLSMGQSIACGEGYKAVDRGVSAALGAASFIPGPVGWVAAGLGIAWNVWDAANGDASPSQQIADGVSAAWNWLTGH